MRLLCAANERCVFGLTEYVITESVCSLGVPRYFAASRAQLFDINDSSRRESKQLHAEREMRRLEGRGGAREEKSSKIAITRILKACRSV